MTTIASSRPDLSTLALTSPNGHVAGEVWVDADGQLRYRVHQRGRTVVEPSAIGITVDGIDLGRGVRMVETVRGRIDETYPCRGWHTQARNHGHTLSVQVLHLASEIRYALELRAYDDGFAYRLVLPGKGTRRVTAEASAWKIPAGTQVWYFERESHWKLKSYAGWWVKTAVENLPTISAQGPVQGPPLVLELPGGGYAAISEAALYHYSGMRLRAIGDRTVQADFTEGPAGFTVDGPITTPWRVTLICDTLDALVNNDLFSNLNEKPDPALYPSTDYIRPGRVAWRWWSSKTGSPLQEKQFIDYAAELGFEFSLIDDGWEKWPHKWQELQKLCDYAKSRNVGVAVWKDYNNEIHAPAENYKVLRDFLDGIKAAGVQAVKIDFMNSEAKEKIDFEWAALHETAKRQIMLFFHGCQKPTGEVRRFPHEMTREGIRGLELNPMNEHIPGWHNAALPFTRFITGHADYTPIGYSNAGDTTFAHQLATMILFTSPLQVVAEHPDFILHYPPTAVAIDVTKAIPAVWDETRVLEPSRIGELALFARRSGRDWFVGGVTGREPRELKLLDLAFLGVGRYHAVILTSPQAEAFERREMHGVTATSRIDLALAASDGVVIHFRRVD